MNKDDSDQRLLVDFLAGDENAFRQLVVRYSSLVHGVSMRILVDQDAAADIFQITFLELIKNASAIRKHQSLASWLYIVAYRNSLRLRSKKCRLREQPDVDMNQISDSSSFSKLRLRHELELMDEEINKLPAKLRDPLVLHYLMGKPQKVVAEELGVRASTVKGRLQRGKNQVRLKLAARGVSFGLVGIITFATEHAANADLRQLVDATVDTGSQNAQSSNPIMTPTSGGPQMTSFLRYTLAASVLGVVAAVSMIDGGSAVADPPNTLDFTVDAALASRLPLRLAQVDAQKTTVTKEATTLKYGDGKPDGKKSLAGTGELIAFTTSSKGRLVRAIKIHGSRYGYPKPPKEDFRILFLDEDMKKVLHVEKAPYSSFKRGASKWTTIRFKKPIEVPSKFWIGLDFNAERTKGVYVSYDTSTEGKYSRIGLPPDQEARQTKFAGDWMVQVMMVKKAFPESNKF